MRYSTVRYEPGRGQSRIGPEPVETHRNAGRNQRPTGNRSKILCWTAESVQGGGPQPRGMARHAGYL